MTPFRLLLLFLCYGLFVQCESDDIQFSQHSSVFPLTVLDFIHHPSISNTVFPADSLLYLQEYENATERYEQLLADKSNTFTEEEQIYLQNQRIRTLLLERRNKEVSVALKAFESKFDTASFSSGNELLYRTNKARDELNCYRGKTALFHLYIADSLSHEVFGTPHLVHLELLVLLGQNTYWYGVEPEISRYIRDKERESNKLLEQHREWIPYAKEHYLWKGHLSFIKRTHKKGIESLDTAIWLNEQVQPIDTTFLIRCYSEKGGLYKRDNSIYAKNAVAFFNEKAFKMMKQYSDLDTKIIQLTYRDYITYCIRDSRMHHRVLSEIDSLEQYTKGVKFAYPLRLKGAFSYKLKDYDQALSYFQELHNTLENSQDIFNRTKIYSTVLNFHYLCYRAKGEWDKSNLYLVKNMLIGTDLYHQAQHNYQDIIRGRYKYNNTHSFMLYSRLADNYVAQHEADGNPITLNRSLELYKIADKLMFKHLTDNVTDEDALLRFGHEINHHYYSNAIQACFYKYQQESDDNYIQLANYYMERMKAVLLYRKMLENSVTPDKHSEYFDPLPTLVNYIDTTSRHDVVLQYSVGNKYLHMILLQKDTFLFKTLPISKKQVKQNISLIMSASVSKNNPSIYIEASHTLFKEFVQPIINDVADSSRLLVISDASLPLIPLEGLLTDVQGKNSFLLSKKNWITSYSSSVKTFLLKEPERQIDFQIPRCVNFSYTLKDIVNDIGNVQVFEETQQVNEHLKKVYKDQGKIRNYFEQNCTGQKFRAVAEKANYNMLCFYIHAVADTNDVTKSYLLFRNDKYLVFDSIYNQEIANLTLTHAPLVVLIACETATGRAVDAEGVFSLTRSFNQAGAGTMISTLWKVKEHQISQLIRYFYTHLSLGKTPSSALYHAKLDYLVHCSNQNDLHPIYWSGLICEE